MAFTIKAMEAPLRIDEDGAVRIGQTRVTLDVLLGEYKGGRNPEDIVRGYPVLTLAQVYAVISYYLTHQEEVDAYLKDGERQAEETERYWRSLPQNQNLRARLQARIAERKAQRGQDGDSSPR